MKLIHIINGTYGYRPQPNVVERKNPADEPFSIEDEEAERLVSLGVAEYAESQAEPEKKGPEDESEAIAEENPIDEDALAQMTNQQLKELAAELAVDVSGLKKKADLISAILRAEAEPAEEEPPVFAALDPE